MLEIEEKFQCPQKHYYRNLEISWAPFIRRNSGRPRTIISPAIKEGFLNVGNIYPMEISRLDSGDNEFPM